MQHWSILFLVQNVVGVGTYRGAARMARLLASHGHKLTLVATHKTNRIRIQQFVENDVRVVAMPDVLPGRLRSGWDVWNIARRMAWIRQQSKFDIVHAFECRPTVVYPALYASRVHVAKLVMDWKDWYGQGGLVEEISNPLIRNTLRPIDTFLENHYRQYANGHTVICTTLKHKAMQLGIAEKDILLLPDPSENDLFVDIPIQQARAQIGLLPEQLQGYTVIGYAGSIFQRDAALMMAAFDRLREQVPVKLLAFGYSTTTIDAFPYDKKQHQKLYM